MKKKFTIIFYLFAIMIIGIIIYVTLINPEILKGNKKATIVSLSQNNIGLKRGREYQLTASVYPSDSSGRRMIYESDNDSVVSVNEITGYIKGLKNGIATITVKLANDEKIYDTCTVEVSDKTIYAKDITVDTQDIKLLKGNKYKIKYQTSPSNANTYKLILQNSDNKVATVNDSYEIEGKEIGKTIITLRETISGKEKEINVNVIEDNNKEEVTIPKEDIIVEVNGSKKVDVNNAENLTWSSLDENIVTVNKEGEIKGKEEGETKIIITKPNGETTYMNVKVTQDHIKVEKLEIEDEEITMNVGEEKNIKVIIEPSNATNQKINWKSNNEEIVKVNNGKIKSLKEGRTVIEAISEDGTKKDSINVIVNKTQIIEQANIKLEKTNYTLKVGESTNIKAEVIPSNATIKDLKYISSNNNIITVKDGMMVAKKKGEAEITIMTNDEKIKKNIKVEVKNVEEESVTLNIKNQTISVKGEIGLIGTISPSNATNKKITWTSSNSNVATVDNNGLVKGIGTGEAIITARTSNGKEATCKIIVTNKEIIAEAISINKKEETLYIGTTSNLVATLTPSNTTNKNITWTSSNTKVATVDNNGKVKGIGIGEAIVTVRTSNGKEATCKIKVSNKNIEVTQITIDKTKATIYVGDEINLNATISPNNATNKEITWTSSDSSIAKVVNGKVTAVKKGDVTITAKTSNGKEATSKIKVNQNQTFTAIFNVQDSKGVQISSKTLSCTTKNTSTCEITSPNITANNGYEAIGYSKNKQSTTKEYGSNERITLSKNETFYTISKNNKPLKATFTIQNKQGNQSGGNTNCYLYNGENACKITTPNLTGANGTITAIGWNTDKKATTASVSSGKEVSISKDTTFYSITKKIVIITYDPGENIPGVNIRAQALSFYSNEHTKCISYNGNGCNIKWIPAIFSPGNIVHGFSKTPNGQTINVAKTKFAEDTTLYARIYDCVDSGSNITAYAPSQYELVGNVWVETEYGLPGDIATNFINFVKNIYKDFPNLLMWNGKITMLTEGSYINKFGNDSAGITFHGTGFASDFSAVFLYYRSNYTTNPSNRNYHLGSVVHEITHAYNYGLYWNGGFTSAISKTDDVKYLYNKYINMPGRPISDYAYTNQSEFLSETMREYYRLHRIYQYNDDPYVSKGNGQWYEDLAKLIEKYNKIGYDYYHSIGRF